MRVSGHNGGAAVKSSTCKCHVIVQSDFLWSHDFWGYFFVPRDCLTIFFLVT